MELSCEKDATEMKISKQQKNLVTITLIAILKNKRVHKEGTRSMSKKFI
jgi:hypothetical protein